jgi:hypothetical protein
MNPENRKAPKLSIVRRQNATLMRAIKKQEKLCIAKAKQKEMITRLQDLMDFNADRIGGKPEDFVEKLQKEKFQRDEAERLRRGY